VIPLDHLDGDFSDFPTDTGKDDKGFYARALGLEARHAFSQEQALAELNTLLYDKVSRGELIPNMGM
jgi:hypothetical protein